MKSLFWALLISAVLVHAKRKDSEEEDHAKPEAGSQKLKEDLFPNAKPTAFEEEATKWMNSRHKYILKKAEDNGANEWERLQRFALIFYEQHESRRKPSQPALLKYCTDNLQTIIGEENTNRLIHLYHESATPEHLRSAFASMTSTLIDDELLNQADQYWAFCRKILRVVDIEPSHMMDWLNDEQRAQLRLLIRDEAIKDDAIYEVVYQFYNETNDKEEAQETIASACRRFIADLFGDDIVEEIEDLKDLNQKPQVIASKLHQFINEVGGAENEPLYGRSVWLCERIYVGFSGHCECGGRADACDETQSCIDCRGNTEGAMCQRCIAGFEWALEGDRCVEACECNGHSIECDDFGTCQNCTDFTRGQHCELCEDGFVGNARGGTETDCKECNCRLDQQCVLNAEGVVECVTPLEAIFEGDNNSTDSMLEALERAERQEKDRVERGEAEKETRSDGQLQGMEKDEEQKAVEEGGGEKAGKVKTAGDEEAILGEQ